jgi:hypothetical protein
MVGERKTHVTNEEIVIGNAVTVWKSAYERTNKLFTSLEDAELLQAVAPERNRLVYLLGHLTAMHDRMYVLLGLGERVHPELDAVFLTAADGVGTLPATEDLRAAWTEVNDRLNAGITGLSVSQWLEGHTAVSAEDFAKDPLRNKLSILLTRTNHLAYHLGQATLVRR